MFFVLDNGSIFPIYYVNSLCKARAEYDCIYKYVYFNEFDGITQHFLVWPKSILQNIIFLAALWVWVFLFCFCFLIDKGETHWNRSQTQIYDLLVSNSFGIRFV